MEMKRSLENAYMRPKKKLKSKHISELNMDISTITTVSQSLSMISRTPQTLKPICKITKVKGRPDLPILSVSPPTPKTTPTTSTISSSSQTKTTSLMTSKGKSLNENKKHSKKSNNKKKHNKQNKLLIIMLGTNKNCQSISAVDSKYCEALNYVNKDYLPDSWVGYLVIRHKVSLTTYINDNKNDKSFQDWVMQCQYFRDKTDSTTTIFDAFSAYMIDEYKEFEKPIKISHSVRQRQYRMYFESNETTNKTLNEIRNNNSRLIELEKKNELIYMGLITATPMIGLMLSGKKKAEFRKTTLSKEILEKKTYFTNIKLSSAPVPPKKNYKKKNIPTRNDIEETKRKPQQLLINAELQDSLSRYNINWKNLSHPIMHDFSVQKVKSFFVQWIFVKDIDLKNKNKSIMDHNKKLIKFMEDCFERLLFWSKKDICTNKTNGNQNYYLLQNFLVILFGFPDQLNTLLLIMNDQYVHLSGVVGHILGITGKCVCRHCNSKVRYRYSIKRRPKYGWICTNKQCRKENSCFANTWMQDFKDKNLSIIFKTWFSIFQDMSQKQCISQGTVKKKKHQHIKKHLKQTLKIYIQHNYIVLGDGNDHCFFDHTFKGIKRKYARGYVKNKKWCIFGGTDKHSLFVLQIVDSERKIETNYYIKKYSTPQSLIDTDCGGAFNDVADLDQRKHRTVNHSGTKDPKTGIVHYFKDPISGVCTNAIEALFSRLVLKFIVKHTNELKKVENLENGIAFFDFQYNRTNNYAQQLFINALMVYNEVYNPLNPESLKIIPREDFTNVYEVQKIISDRPSTRKNNNEREFLIHWKGFALHQSTWHHIENLTHDAENLNWNGKLRIIEEYDLLSNIDKQKRIQAYNKSVSAREKREIEKNSIPMLTLSKYEKFMQSQQKKDALKIILKDGIINVRQNRDQQQNELDTKIIKVNAIIASQKSLESIEESEKHDYKVHAVFHDGTPVEWQCECLAHEQLQIQKKNLMCKHCIVVMLELSVEGQNMIKKHRENQSFN